MNFLAHLFLSCEHEATVVGNFLADFIANRDVANYPPGVRAGIVLHRKIDHFTDNHPLVRQATHRLHPFHHKYAAVVVDIFYDYLLAINWGTYSKESLPEFAERTYRILEKNASLMPEYLQQRLTHMVKDNWLVQYGKLEGIAFTFRQLRKRVSRPQYIEHAVDSLQRDLPYLQEEFKVFFPEVIHYVNQECGIF